MKCTLHADSFGRFVLKAQAGEYDGLPVVSEIFIDIPPVKRNQFRSAVAASLPFIAKTNGALETADAFFPLSASLLGQLAPFDVICQNIRWEPADIPGGSGILVLSAGASLTPLRAQVFPEEPDVAEVRLSKSGDFHGQISGPRLCLSASNLWLVRELDGISAFLLGLVAVGLLLAEDFDARRLVVVTSEIPEDFDTTALSRLCESVGVQVEFVVLEEADVI